MDSFRRISETRRIGLLPLPGFAAMSYASVSEPLRAANLLSGRTLYDVTHFAPASGVRSSGAVWIPGAQPVGAGGRLDMLLVVAGGDPMAFDDADTFRWLRRLAGQGVTLGGVSGGPVVLARAGLMGGRRMTVHWEHAPALAELDGGWLLERSLYVIDRDRVTCAGGTAPMDLMHALIATHHGPDFARLVSDWFLHTDIRPPSGPQRGGLVERLGTRSVPVLDSVAAMESHIADPLSLSALAKLARVTPRQLNRLFRDKLGQSTMQVYRDLRLDVARRLIEHSPIAMTEIALATGFANSAHFSRAYSKRFGHAPSKAR